MSEKDSIPTSFKMYFVFCKIESKYSHTNSRGVVNELLLGLLYYYLIRNMNIYKFVNFYNNYIKILY